MNLSDLLYSKQGRYVFYYYPHFTDGKLKNRDINTLVTEESWIQTRAFWLLYLCSKPLDDIAVAIDW